MPSQRVSGNAGSYRLVRITAYRTWGLVEVKVEVVVVVSSDRGKMICSLGT